MMRREVLLDGARGGRDAFPRIDNQHFLDQFKRYKYEFKTSDEPRETYIMNHKS